MSNIPQYASTPNLGICKLTTAETNRASPTNIVSLFTAGSNGSRVERITINTTATSALGAVWLWIQRSGTYYLYTEFQVSAKTGSATVLDFNLQTDMTAVGNIGLILKSGDVLYASTTITQNMNVFAEGADF